MPIQTTCPQCQSQYRLPDTQMGKRVRCKKCQSVFIAGEVVDAPVLQEASGDEAPRGKRHSRMDMAIEELPVFDEVTTAPRARHTPPPARRPLDDRPPRRDDDYDPRDEEPAVAGGSSLVLILAGVGALVLLVGGGLVAAWFFMQSGPDMAGTQTEGGGQGQSGWPNNNNNNGGRPIINRPVNNKPQDFDTALAYLRAGNSSRRRMALDYLLNDHRVDPARRDELDKALAPLLADRTHKKEVMKVILRWGGRHKVVALEEQMKDHFAWKEAMAELSRMKDERAAEMIAEHLGKVFHEEEAAKALRRMGKVAEKAAVKYLHHRRAREHVLPLVKAWRTDDETLAEQALEDLVSKDREVKDAAAETLASCKPAEKLQDKVAKALAEHMKEDWFGSRKKTAKALAIWGTTDTVGTINAYMSDRELEVRVLMIAAAARLKDDSSIVPLVNRLGADEKAIAAKAILLYGSKAEDAVLLLLDNKKREVRDAGIELLSVIGTKKSVPLLVKLAKLGLAAKKDVAAAVKLIEAREEKGKEKEKGN